MIAFTYFSSLYEPKGRRYTTTWEKLLTRLSVPRVSPTKEGPGLSLATYRGDYRELANVDRVFAVGIDLDKLDALSVFTKRPPSGEVRATPDWDELRRKFNAASAFVHTTWQSTLQLPRLRVFLRLSRPVTGEEYRRVYRAVAKTCEEGGLVVDRAASDPSRFWYLPSSRDAASFVFWTCAGRPLDVEAALRSVPPPAPPPPPRAGTIPSNAEERAAKYLDRCEPAVSGSGGHNTTFMVAQRLVRGFCLDEETAYRLMCGWNLRCSPPWSEHELRRKIREAVKRGTIAEGSLLDAPRSR